MNRINWAYVAMGARFLVAAGAAWMFWTAGDSMYLIHYPDPSLEEAFYGGMGVFSHGMALLAIVIGLPSLPKLRP